MAPLKIYIEILLIGLTGLGIGLLLLVRLRGPLRILSLLFFASVALLLSSTFLPCFNPFGGATCRGLPSEKSIALTFDDGPNEPFTSQILDILRDQKVPATFFLVGKNLEGNREVVRRMIREGHLVGNHTWDHRSLVLMTPSAIREEIDLWEGAMEKIGIPSPKLFRAPHGWKGPFLPSILNKKGYRLIGWTRGVWDSDQPGTEVLYKRLTRLPKNGEIILLHDGGEARQGVDRSQTVEVLTRMIRFYKSHGFRFVTVGEVMED